MSGDPIFCPDCGQPLVAHPWNNGKEAFRLLCGRAGYDLICPEHGRIKRVTTVMN